MQNITTTAVPGGPNTDRRRAASKRRQRLLVLLMALAVIAPLYAGGPGPVDAAASCTGWGSINTPPDTIRVGRNDGTVDVVDFHRYVGVVMAMEWPYWLPKAALEVGAVAVKQYGWYWSMAGHHRSGLVNSRGKCFDVYDSTRDQLYKPEKVSVHRPIWAAIERTWDLTLRKNGRFFMTGYRYGADVRCGRDVDGWKVYERSVVDCAKRGRSSHDIQLKYLDPGLSFYRAGAKVLAATATPKPTPRPTLAPTPEPTLAPTPDHTPTIIGELTEPMGLGPVGQAPAIDIPELDAADWAELCLTTVGSLPDGQYEALGDLPPPFGCAPPAEGPQPIDFVDGPAFGGEVVLLPSQ